MTQITDLFNIKNEVLNSFFGQYTYPYELLSNIHNFILEIGNKLGDDYQLFKENVWIHKTVKIEQGVEIIGPAIIMDDVRLRHSAYIRENVIIGTKSIIGNSCEIKNSILISNVEIPHFNYVGDSILGNHVHLGAGAVLSNLRLDKETIKVEKMNTNLRKVGAFVGDNVQIGCNSVVCPGTVIYPEAIVYPLTLVNGIIEKGKIIKDNGIEVKKV